MSLIKNISLLQILILPNLAFAAADTEKASNIFLGLVEDILVIALVIFMGFFLAGIVLFLKGLKEFYNASDGRNGSNAKAIIMILVGALLLSSPLMLKSVRSSIFGEEVVDVGRINPSNIVDQR